MKLYDNIIKREVAKMFGACAAYGGPVSWLAMGFGIITHLAFTAVLVLSAIWLFKTVFRKPDGGNNNQQ